MLLALGANLESGVGSPRETIVCATDDLAENGINVTARSRLFHTPCFPPGAGPDFVNAALLCDSALTPGEILAVLGEIEACYGREPAARWDARCLDIDILAVGDLVLPDRATFEHWRDLTPDQQQRETPAKLILPHPRLQDRGFVLVPLADVAPGWRHPVSKRSVDQMLRRLPAAEIAGIRPL